MTSRMTKITQALRNNWKRQEEGQWLYGKLGRYNGTNVIFEVKGRKNFLYVTIRNASGSQTSVPARNDAGVPQTENLPVKIRLQFGVYVIEGVTGKGDEGGAPVVPPSGIPLHADSHKHGGVDEVGTETPGAFQIPKAESNGNLNNSWLNTGHSNGIDVDTVDGDHASDLKNRANHTGTQLSSTISDFSSAVSALVSSVISAFSAKNPPVDADSFVITDSAASNVPKRVTGTNVKAWLKAYLDTLYGLLAGNNTWTGTNDFENNVSVESTATTGNSFAVLRNLTATSTNAPMVAFVQDHASDDQAALIVQQDGTGDIFSMYDGATLVLSLEDGGKLSIGPNTAPDALLYVEGNVTELGHYHNTGSGSGANDFSSFYFSNPHQKWSVNVGAHGNATWLDKFYLFDNTNSRSIWLATLTGQFLVGNIQTGNATRLGIQPNTSSNDAAVGGVLYVTTTQGANSGSGETNLASYTVPADTLLVNNQSIWVEAHGTTAANTNAKTIRLKFGLATIATFSLGTANNAQWSIRARGYRTGSSATKWVVFLSFEITGSTHSSATRLGTSSDALNSGRAVTITGQATSTSDILLEAMIVGWDDANT